MRDRIRRSAAVASALPLVFAMATAAQAAPQARSKVAGESGWTQTAPALGAAPSGSQVHGRVYLAPRGGQAALDAAVLDVSTPGSASYRHFLTAAQYRARFEATSGAVKAVTGWLSSQGLRVTGIEASRRYVAFAGDVAHANTAFGTTIRQYRHAGQSVQAPAAPVSVPSSIAHFVAGVGGLDSTKVFMKPQHTIPPPPGFRNARPCSLYYGQIIARFEADFTTPLPQFMGAFRPYQVCGYTPIQLRSAYMGATANKLDGAGVTVGILDAYNSSTILKDANEYATRHDFSQTFVPGQYTGIIASNFTNNNLCGAPGWANEQTLDVESVHGMALGANVRYYGATSCLDTDLMGMFARAVDENRVDIMTDSFGEPEEGESAGSVAGWHQLFAQAAMQGISTFFSTGDDGDFSLVTGLRQAGYPASDPLVTAVGGTTIGIDPNGNVEFQTGWGNVKWSLSQNGNSWVNPRFNSGAGGGFSSLFNRPAYQNRLVPAGATRAVPDVSLDADPTTGMLIGETQQFPEGRVYDEFKLGGTSLASPLMAGVQAMADEHATGRVGLINPTVYSQVRNNRGTFADVLPVHTGDAAVRADFVNGVNPSDGVVYSVRTFNQDTSLTTTAGWDDVTGLGTPTPRYPNAFGSSSVVGGG